MCDENVSFLVCLAWWSNFQT